jgi:DNA repair exonuclease SbcCD ATPase subunit
MKLLWIALKNFMRFRNAKLSLADAGMTLIEGINKDDESATSNGAGKSTIVDALLWCLYGVTTHDPGAEGDDVVNEKRGRNCEVVVGFDVKGKTYKVTRRRAWKKGGKAVQLNMLNVTDEAEHTKGTIRDTQVAIDTLIGMGVATFRHACIFGHGRAYRFSTLTDTEKKAVLDEMLGSEQYAKAGARAADRLLLLERELTNAQSSLDASKESYNAAHKRLRKLQAHARESAANVDGERLELSDKLKRIHVELAFGDGTLAFANAKKVLESVKRAEDNTIDVVMKANRAVDKARLDKLRIEREIEALDQRIVELEEKIGLECPTCEQMVSAKHLRRVFKQLKPKDRKLRRTLTRKCKQEERAEKDLKLAERERKEARKRVNQASDELVMYREHCVKQRQHAQRERELVARVKELARADEYHQKLIADERKVIKKLKRKVRVLRAFVRARKTEVNHLRFWHQGFSAKGLRSLMLDSALPYLNAKLETYTNALTAGHIAVEFKTQRRLKGGGLREDFHVEVSNRYGATRYNMNSVGERAKIDIVVGLALQDMAASRSRVPINVAFFDEVFDGLDDRGTDRAVQVLSQLKRESAFVITHNDSLKAFFSRRMCVIKEAGESRLEQV